MSPTFRYDAEKHEYSLLYDDGRVEILPSVTFIFDYHGFVSDFAKNERAAHRGTMAHLAAQYIFQKRLDWSTVDPELIGYCKSLELWIKLTGFVAEATEIQMYHPLLKFAGTSDVRGYMPDGSRWVLDVKTGLVARWHSWQLSGYLILEGGYRRRGGLYLRKSGKIAKFKEYASPADEGNFLALLRTYQLKEGTQWQSNP